MTTVADAQAQFRAEGVYLNTASLGLPPAAGLAAVRGALTEWEAGRVDIHEYDADITASRQSYAQLVQVDPSDVAIGSQVSVFVGLVAASLPDRSEVLAAQGEFTSVTFPFLAHAHRGVRLREVPLEQLADAVTTATTLVAVSAVQSADGRLADLDALVQACARTGTRIMLDTTQAVGWLPVDASRFAYTMGGGYKWLLAPRGTAFFTAQRELLDDLVPVNASWYAGASPWDSIYGAPLRLSRDARRFDVSPAWFSWVGQAPALELLVAVGTDALHRHAVGLANRFLDGVGLPSGESAIVSLAVDAQAADQMAQARVTGSVRAGRLRLAFHLHNTAEDADCAAQALRGHLS